MKNLFSIFILALILVSCSSKNTPIIPSENKINLAAILDFSGHYSQFGAEIRNGMEIALSEVNNVSVTYFDSKGLSDEALMLLDSIKQDSTYDVVVTMASWISNDLALPILDAEMLQIAVGSAVYIHTDNRNCVRFTKDVNDEMTFLAQELTKYDNIAIMYFDNDYGNGWFSTLSTTLGAKIKVSEKYQDTQTDFTQQLTNIKTVEPDFIVLISTSEAVDIVKQARAMNITAQFIGTRPTLTNFLLQEPTANGLLFSYPKMNEDMPFFNKYKDVYGERASAFSAEGYDVVKSISMAFNENDRENIDLFNWYRNRTFWGALGSINFDVNSQANYPFTLMVIEDGTYKEKK